MLVWIMNYKFDDIIVNLLGATGFYIKTEPPTPSHTPTTFLTNHMQQNHLTTTAFDT